ncbi:MAG: kelch repeat-containing protein [Acidobacteriaceae bacterium]
MALHAKEKKEPEVPFFASYGKDQPNHHGCCRGQKRAPRVEGFRAAVYLAALYLTVLALGFTCSTVHAQTNEWVWMGGGANQRPVYGTLGTPAPGNIPGNQSGMAHWKDNKGNFWLFGGDGADSAGTGGALNDLWKFNPATLEWEWVSGSSVLTVVDFMGSQDFVEPGIYGTLGTPAAGNFPGGRNSPAAWTDNSGNLWLFGGYGSISTGYIGYFNDLWEFNPSTVEWTWMGGSNTIPTNTGGEPGVYGTLGTAAAGNIPGARYEAVSWTDHSGNLWLFGGYGFDSAGDVGPLNDLWAFSPSTNQWTWVAGSSTVGSSPTCSMYTCGRPGVYGAAGAFAAANTPGGRYGAVSWTDSSGKLWLFGGTGLGLGTNVFFLNDLWEFDPSIRQWAWISGSSTPGTGASGIPGEYGTLGVPAAGNRPGSRTYATASIDNSGNLWLFGGWGWPSLSQPDAGATPGYLDDLWEFNVASQQWVWAGGSSTVPSYNQGNPGVYGTLGTPAAGNLPGGRNFAVSWTDENGNFWLYGGGSASAGFNDLWEFRPSPIVWPVPTFTVSGTPVTVTPGATSGNTSTITLTPNGGFTGNVTLTAAVTSSPAGAQYPPGLSFGSTNPMNITSANAGTATLTVATTGPSTSALSDPIHSGSVWSTGGATFACLLFLGMPMRRRGWMTMLGTLALLVAFTSGLLACGGGSSGGIGTGIPGSTPGVYTVTVTGTSGTTTATGIVTVTVQ